MSAPSSPAHLIRLADLSRAQLDDVLDLSMRLKRRGKGSGELAGRTAGLLFFRGSLRTRTSFEAAMMRCSLHQCRKREHTAGMRSTR